jgi:hypothetical protein
MASFLFQLASAHLRWRIVGSFAGYALAFVAAARLHGPYDEKALMIWKTMMIWSAVASAAFPAMPVVLRLRGRITANGDPLRPPTLPAFSALRHVSDAIPNIR